MVSICGYIVQFIGLRGMHWSASIAQLGATAVMTIFRAWVRRKLADPPISQRLLSGYELDLLAVTLGANRMEATWLHPSKADEKRHSRCWADDGDWDWKIVAIDDPSKRNKLNPCQESQPQDADTRCTAHGVMMIRRDLGELAGWHGPASAEAVTLVRAIEVTMDAFFGTATQNFTWSFPAQGSLDASDRESITFRVDRLENGNWKAYSDEIEATLSLWLYSAHEYESGSEDGSERAKKREDGGISPGTPGTDGHGRPSSKSLPFKDDAWLRVQGTPAKHSLRLLGSCRGITARPLVVDA